MLWPATAAKAVPSGCDSGMMVSVLSSGLPRVALTGLSSARSTVLSLVLDVSSRIATVTFWLVVPGANVTALVIRL